jgi:hypothetical protein
MRNCPSLGLIHAALEFARTHREAFSGARKMAVSDDDFERAHTIFSGLLRMMDGPAPTTTGYDAARKTKADAQSRGSLKLESRALFSRDRGGEGDKEQDDDEAEKPPEIVEENAGYFQGPFRSAREVINRLSPRPPEDLEYEELFEVLEQAIEYIAQANGVSRCTAAMAFGFNIFLEDATTDFIALYVTLGRILDKQETAPYLSADCSHSSASVNCADATPPKRSKSRTRKAGGSRGGSASRNGQSQARSVGHTDRRENTDQNGQEDAS